MTERPSTATGSNRNFNQALTSPLRPNTSGGPGISVTGASPTGSRTPPPNENRRSISGASSSPRPKAKESTNTFCRNITIYGYCRYQDKGCAFNHDPHSQKQQSGSGRGKFNVDSPSFTPATPPKKTISPNVADAAPFTPKHTTGNTLSRANSAASRADVLGVAAPPVAPQFHDPNNGYSISHAVDHQQNYQLQQHGFDPIGLAENNAATNAMNAYEFPVPQSVNPYAQTGDMFFPQTQSYTPLLPYHRYAPLAPFPQKLLPFQRNIHGFFMSDNLREELQRKAEITLQSLPSVSSLLPPAVEEFHSLVPLDTSNQKNINVFGYPSWVYKAFSNEDANPYALRRVEGFRLSNEADIRIVQRWKKVLSANIVTIHNAWTTTKFGDSSIIFVYDYHPLSKTLAETHFGPSPRYTTPRHSVGPIVPEQVLWSYIVQIASALKVIHSAGLAARVIEGSKILVTSKMRIRLNCCGILDVIHPDTIKTQDMVREAQLEDLTQLGRLMLSVACNTPTALQNFQKSMDYIRRHYSMQLHDSIYLLATGATKSVEEFIKTIANQAFQNFDSALHYEDSLESELSRELENGRLVRLLCKFGFINERPEFDHDPRWSETGDRYYLKLFRDYVFHSVDENGQPVVDIAHVLSCLNKLDAGVDERIMLVSRDSMNCFVVTYKELKRQVETCFQDLNKNNRR
ncbi:uncharacterized protein H6S33_005943 [Morchella sextelata]|uniref:uncharacterized protein n=1 Tax=Morchella sextelata TaxID=1174677 RepID=UPI001D059D7D|nr:uncharacterized protein H6S33_005943 [Morchella sextelata]KAH0614057.1 hypothetical protein H6S33_005943 [Morchella sextelata]